MTQSDERLCSVSEFMRSAAFQRGVADKRAKRPPRFDKETEGGWLYECGRFFATLAPRDLPVVDKRGRVTPRAAKLLQQHMSDVLPERPD